MGRLIRQFFKFGVVGVANTFVDLAVLTLLIKLEPSGAAGLLYAAFKAIAFIVANINSYVFNKIWTFRGEGSEKKTSIEFSKYFLVSLVGISLNVGVATFVVTYVSPPFATAQLPGISQTVKDVWPQISALFGTAAGLLWNFVGYKRFVFQRRNGLK